MIIDIRPRAIYELSGKVRFRTRFIGLILAIGFLFAVLVLNSAAYDPSIASAKNAFNTSISGVVNVSDAKILGANGAPPGTELHFRSKKPTPAERTAAAERFRFIHESAQAKAAAKGLTAVPSIFDPGGIPHYFGPYPNWANSPMPKGAITSITLVSGGSGYSSPVVTISDAYNDTGVTQHATATATVNPTTGAITSITLVRGGSGYTAPVVIISGPPGTGADATATIGNTAGTPLSGGIHKFVDSLPNLTAAGANDLGQYIPVAVPDKITYPNSDYYETAVIQYKEKLHKDLPPTTLRGYVQIETGVNRGTSKHIALKYPNGTAILNSTRGQVYAYDRPNYLGPMIVAQNGRPVRVKFHNYLPTGVDGNLFIPVDTTVMGAGMGPLGMNVPPGMPMNYTQNRATVHLHGGDTVWISDGTPHQWITPAGEKTPYPKGVSVMYVPDMDNGNEPPGTLTFFYTNNESARLMFYHDHAYGITRLNVYAGMAAPYLLTDSVEQDLINGTNKTGVNPGNLKLLPGLGIPLVIQDKTFVDNTTIYGQDPTWNWGTGPRVNGKIIKAITGDLWIPHVYLPNQNPYDPGGANAFGRWDYAPWFWPPAGDLVHGPIKNPYYDPVNAPWESPVMPATPNPSMGMEAFMDTPIVNGVAYPNMTVDPKPYRFRILNAANDRFLNLQLYSATNIISNISVNNGGRGYTNPGVVITDPYGRGATAEAIVSNGSVTGIRVLTVGSNYSISPFVTITGTNTSKATAIAHVYTGKTEVGMVPAVATSGYPAGWPTDGREGGVPDPATMGPSFIQVGTEGGFLPAPAVIRDQPVTWIRDFLLFMFGIVDKRALELGPAVRADVIVDFSKYAGKTLILYNDAPAGLPNNDPRWDYYTGDPDQVDSGGAPTTQPGYGPNTRTIMQINVRNIAPAAAYNLTNLNKAFAKSKGKRGVFEVSQPPIIVPQAAYDSAYNKTFTTDITKEYVQLFQHTHTFQNITGTNITIKLEPKASHDEMGATYDQDYGRMSSMMGLEVPNATTLTQNFVLYGYASPPVDLINDSMIPMTPPSGKDGTQIWKIVHNGVDSHIFHWHLFNVQLINRVGWDGVMVPPDANELGWKESVRVDPLEQTVVALRPVAPKVPFKVPNSTRLIDPTMPAGATLRGPPLGGFFDPMGNGVTVTNHLVNFGWEYVMHCHLLSHEEMDMMQAQVLAVPPEAPSNLTANPGGSVILAWKDNSASETGFIIQKALDPNFTKNLTTFTVGPNVATYKDTAVDQGVKYYYRVCASNVVGDSTKYPAPAVGFPTISINSTFSNTATIIAPIPAPTNLQATLNASHTGITLTWIDASTVETSFSVWRSDNGAAYTQIGTVPRTPAESAATGGIVTYTNTNTAAAPLALGHTYRYYVTAVNGKLNPPASSAPSNVATMPFTIPAAPTGLNGAAVRIPGNIRQDNVTLKWTDNSNNENGFQIQRSFSPSFAAANSFAVGANVVTFSQNVARVATYYYRVRATNVLGNSGWSNVARVTAA